MNIFSNEGDTGGAEHPLSNRRTLGGVLVAIAILVALTSAIGISFTPQPTIQVDAETAAVQKGVTAFIAGAFNTAFRDIEPLAKQGNYQAQRLRNRLLKVMQDDEIKKAQTITEKMAPDTKPSL
jgi:hypothetical protein